MKRSFRVRAMRGQPYQLIMSYEDGSEIVIKESSYLDLLSEICDLLNSIQLLNK